MKNILVAVDCSRLSEAIVAEGVATAKEFGARLHLAHVILVPPEMPANLWATSTDRVYEALSRDAREDLDRLIASVPPDLRGDVMIRIGIAWREICAIAQERDVDLIVIGAHGHGFVDRVLGTTAARIVNHADRSVFVVRRKEARP